MGGEAGRGLAEPLRGGQVTARPGPLRLVPGVTMAALVLPLAAGVWGTVMPALRPGAMSTLWDWQGLWPAARLSLVTGLGSTGLALAITLSILAGLRGTRAFGWLVRFLSPLLSVPHAAAALGIAFLIAPSGWIVRAVSPWATGWEQPPDLLILNDPAGLALMFGLVAKEVPFLLLMALAALPRTDASRRIALAGTLGYGPAMGFVLTVLPALYAQLRLPCYAVLAYAMTTVDMAQILGPTRPPTLSVQITLWMTDAGLTQRPVGAAAALLQLGLVGAALGLWRVGELAGRAGVQRLAIGGHRWPLAETLARPLAGLAAGLITAALIAGLAGLALWSVAGLWNFPDALPESLSLRIWAQAGPGLWQATVTSTTLAVATAGIAVALVLGCLEAEHRYGLAPGRAQLILWLPLLIPQIAFLPGLQAVVLAGGLGGWSAVLAAHLVFALPYAFLSLAPAFRAMDPRLAVLAASLGASDNRVFWAVRLPVLLRPILTAAAIAFAVSVGQYLPSLLIGGGRIETLTTEAVALSSGGNRRVIGAYALLQLGLPALAFGIALILPAVLFRHRKGMAT
jgi:putative thiamine transport system permease protein